MRREDLPIELPCARDWNTMTAAGMKRFCADCKKLVHDLSAMSEPEAKALLASSGDLCVRYVHDAEGTIVFDVPEGTLVRAKRYAAVAVAAALPMSLAACMGAAPAREPMVPDQPPYTQTMGYPAQPVAVDADGGAPAADAAAVPGLPVAK
jgi:hypothetical protein